MWAVLIHIQHYSILVWELIAQTQLLDEHGQEVGEIEVKALHFFQTLKFLLAYFTLVNHIQVSLRCYLYFDLCVVIIGHIRHYSHA